jgi:hypothetical protein
MPMTMRTTTTRGTLSQRVHALVTDHSALVMPFSMMRATMTTTI